MLKPYWHTLDLDDGVLREPTPDQARLVLWLPGQYDQGFWHWQRIGNVPGAPIFVQQDLCATAATAMAARQPAGGFFRKLLQRFRTALANQTWVLPNGAAVEQTGPRQTDLMLVWAENDNTTLVEERIRACWPQGKRVQKLARNLFLLAGVEPAGAGKQPALPKGLPANKRSNSWLPHAGLGIARARRPL